MSACAKNGLQAKSAINEHRVDAAAEGLGRLRLDQRHRVPHHRDLPEHSAGPPASTSASLHLGDLVLVDRGTLRLGDVRAISSRTPAYAVMVATEHDVGRAAVVGAFG